MKTVQEAHRTSLGRSKTALRASVETVTTTNADSDSQFLGLLVRRPMSEGDTTTIETD